MLLALVSSGQLCQGHLTQQASQIAHQMGSDFNMAHAMWGDGNKCSNASQTTAIIDPKASILFS